jgi:quinol monooxygenase YgiN
VIDRRTFIVVAAGAMSGAATNSIAQAASSTRTGAGMYGVMGKMSATPGSRDALIAILLEGTAAMPGCLSYVVARDIEDADGIWITEVWESEAHHKGSLSLPAVQAAIAKARPMIAGFSNRVITAPAGGVGLARPSA